MICGGFQKTTPLPVLYCHGAKLEAASVLERDLTAFDDPRDEILISLSNALRAITTPTLFIDTGRAPAGAGSPRINPQLEFNFPLSFTF